MKTIQDLKVGDSVALFIEYEWQVVDGTVTKIKLREEAFYYEVDVNYKWKSKNQNYPIAECNKIFRVPFDRDYANQMQTDYSMVTLFLNKSFAYTERDYEMKKVSDKLINSLKLHASNIRDNKSQYEYLMKEISDTLKLNLVV